MQSFQGFNDYVFYIFFGLLSLSVLKAVIFSVRYKRVEKKFKQFFIEKGFVEREEKESFKTWTFLERNGVGLGKLYSTQGKGSRTSIFFYKNITEQLPHFTVLRLSNTFFVKNGVQLLKPLVGRLLGQEEVVFKNPELARTFSALVTKTEKSPDWVEGFINKHSHVFNLNSVKVYNLGEHRFELEVSVDFLKKEENLLESEKILSALESFKV